MSHAGPAAAAAHDTPFRLSGVGTAVIVIATLISVWILALGRHDYPAFHTALDTGIFILALLLTFFLSRSHADAGPPLSAWLGISFAVVSLLATLHLASSLDWFGVLAPISDSGSRWRPATWPPAVHVLPLGVALAISPWCRRGRSQGVFAAGMILVSVVCLYIFSLVPRYTAPGWLGITRPFLVLPPILWVAVAIACWRGRSRNRLSAPLAVMSTVLALANTVMLYSQSPHDGPAMVAHLGRVTGFFVLLASQMDLASSDLGARLAAEAELATLNRELEDRVLDRTAQVEEASRMLKAEVEIRLAAEDRFRAVVESSPSGMVMVDGNGRISLVNREIERLFGYTRAELLGRPIEELIPIRFRGHHPGFRDSLMREPHSRAMGAGRDLFGLRQDGTEVPVEIGLNPIETAEGMFVLASVVDISARKAAEASLTRSNEALTRAQARFEVVVESAPSGMVMIDGTGRIALVNREVERLFGYTRAELLGRPIEELIPVRFRGGHVAFRTSFMGDPNARAMGVGRDLFGLRHDGVEFPVEIGLNPIETAEGVFVLASVVDISARKATEGELRRSNEELERFAYVASHDLQEPLRMVGSYVQLLAKRYQGKLDQDADDFIGFAVDGAMRMQRLIEDLLAFSRVGSRGGALVPVDLDGVASRVLHDLRVTIEETSALVTRETLPTVQGDEVQLAQLLQNLVANALKFRGTAPPRVHIAASLAGASWEITVADNGIGIDPQYFERIFVLFQRLHTREQYSGTGMGLAIARKIVERHHGRIWVESAPGVGSTFHFLLRGATPAT